jgi:predicted nuclease with RNAse H fold
MNPFLVLFFQHLLLAAFSIPNFFQKSQVIEVHPEQ